MLSSALHLAELVVGISEVTTGAAARDVPEVAVLPCWVIISAKSRAHIQFHIIHLDDRAHMHAVE